VIVFELTVFPPLSIGFPVHAPACSAPSALNVFDILCPLHRIYARRPFPTGKIEAIAFTSKPLCCEVENYPGSQCVTALHLGRSKLAKTYTVQGQSRDPKGLAPAEISISP
jgi:hypothetical protein